MIALTASDLAEGQAYKALPVSSALSLLIEHEIPLPALAATAFDYKKESPLFLSIR